MNDQNKLTTHTGSDLDALITRLRRGLTPCLILAVFISLILIYHHVELRAGLPGPPLCNISGFDCEAVAKSGYSEVFGVPVAAIGLAFYILMFGVLYLPNSDPKKRCSLLALLSAFSLLPTFALAGISIFIIGKLCLYCVLLDAVNVGLFVCTIVLVPPTSGLGTYSERLLLGVEELVASPYRALTGRQGRGAVLTMFIVTALEVLAFHSPRLMEEHLIAPRAFGQVRVNQINDAVADWRRSIVYTVPVNSSSDPLTKDYAKGGAAGSPITVIEFSDFECPICQRFAFEVKPVLQEFSSARFVFKNFPLDNSCNRYINHERHRFACRMAVMARCAGEQGDDRFWEMHDALVSLGVPSDTDLRALPPKLGLNVDKFLECMDSGRQLNKVREDIELAHGLTLRGTPSVFINGKALLVVFADSVRGVLTELTKGSN